MQDAFWVALIEPDHLHGQAIIDELERMRFITKVVVISRLNFHEHKFLFRGKVVGNANVDVLQDNNFKLLIYCGTESGYPFYRSKVMSDSQSIINVTGCANDIDNMYFDQMELIEQPEITLSHPIAYQATLILEQLNNLFDLNTVNLFVACSVSTAGTDGVKELIAQSKESMDQKDSMCVVFPKKMAFNCLSNVFNRSHFSQNQFKNSLLNQIQFYFSNLSIEVDLSLMQIPVIRGHMMQMQVTTKQEVCLKKLKDTFTNSGIIDIVSLPNSLQHGMQKNKMNVGDLNLHPDHHYGLSLTVVADELGFGIGGQLRSLLIRKFHDINIE